MKCSFCGRDAWHRCARTGVLLCPQHAGLEIVALRAETSATSCEVRAATPKDYSRLKKSALHFWGETEVECFDKAYDVQKLPAFVVSVDDELAGFLSYAVEGDALKIVMLNVLPDDQGAGLGKQLLKAAVVEARRKGLSRLIVATSNDDLLALYLYQRAGFVIEEVVPRRILEHHGGVEKGFSDIAIRDEIRLELPLPIEERVE
jgi:ribosomal protein S18 acetylase RimI-like enzyme